MTKDAGYSRTMNQQKFGEYVVHHFSTGHIGGAGLAARRLNARLNLGGQASYFYALARHDFEPEENEFVIKRTWFRRIQGAFFSRLQAPLARKTLFTPLSGSAVSIRFFTQNFDKSKDIIHFHNWFNLVSLKTILDLDREGYTVVLTIHDQRFMTAGCHYAFQCNGFQNSCGACPILPRRISPILEIRHQKELSKYQASHGITLIAPSEWILNQALMSKSTGQMSVVKIENVLGPKWLETIENISTLRKIRQGSNPFYIGVASMDPSSYIKGGDIIDELQSYILRHKINMKIVNLKDVSDKVSDFWGRIDLLFVPSRADNSPNVILEAKSVGIPTLASRVGGIPELLESDFDALFSIESDSIDEIFTKIVAIQQRKISNRIRLSSDSQSQKSHLSLYSDLILKNSEMA